MSRAPQLHPRCTLLVRTYFGDPAGWAALLATIETPTSEGFLAGVDVIDDVSYDGLSVTDLRTLIAQPNLGPFFVLVADEQAILGRENPILVAPLPAPSPELDWLNETPRPEFRVIALKLWSVENNLSLANLDWRDFVDHASDGIFRGF